MPSNVEQGDIVETLSTNKSDLIILIQGEDEPQIADEIAEELERLGYTATIAASANDAVRDALANGPALLIIDRALGGSQSPLLIETLRGAGIQAPIIFVSVPVSVDQRIRGWKAGADGYITKPFEMEELTACVEALLRRSNRVRTQLCVGPLKMDLIDRRVWRETKEINLLPREFKILEYFITHANQVITRTALLEAVWNHRFGACNLVDVHIGKLRRKVDGFGETPLIESVRGQGFMLHVGATKALVARDVEAHLQYVKQTFAQNINPRGGQGGIVH